MSEKENIRNPIRLIKAGEIKRFYSMQKAIDAMERAFSALSSGKCYVPNRVVTKLPADELLMLFKPAFVEKEKTVTIKFLTQREKGNILGVPAIQGIVMVIDSETGEIISIMDGEYITALRTGAASGLATRFFARKNAQALALFGCGAQGITQIEAILSERDIKKICLFDKDRNRALSFIEQMQEKLNVEMTFCTDTSVLKEVDIICTATNATAPLFKREEVKKGVHINAIGSFQPHMQELDPYLIRDAKVYVDHAEACLNESGDFIKAREAGIISNNPIVGEIGDYCLKNIPGRESDDEITIFKSVGVAIQDYAVATDIFKFSQEKGFGQEIGLFE